MTATAKEKREVTLPEGVSLRRVAEVLVDAWEPLFALLEPHILPTDLKELKKIVSEEQQRIAKAERESQS